MLSFKMWSNLCCYELKIDYCRDKLLYVSLLVTTKQKPVVNIHMIKRKQYKHTTKESHQTTKRVRKEEKNREELQKQPENN